MTPHGMTAKAGHREAAQTATKEERRMKAWRALVDRRLTYAQIGAELNVSSKTVCLDLAEVRQEMHAETFQLAETWRDVETARCEQADRAILPLLYHKSPMVRMKAHTRLVASSERRARLWGADMPQKVALTDPTGTRRYHELSDEELARLVEQKRALAGLKPAGAASLVAGNGNGHHAGPVPDADVDG